MRLHLIALFLVIIFFHLAGCGSEKKPSEVAFYACIKYEIAARNYDDRDKFSRKEVSEICQKLRNEACGENEISLSCDRFIEKYSDESN